MVRRHTRLTTFAALALAALIAVACGGGGGGEGASEGGGGAAAGGDSVTIGVIAPTQGVFAEIGQNMIEGAEVAADQINADGGAAGMDIVVEVRDEGPDPEIATQAARDFTAEGVPLMVGLLSSVDCLAVGPVVDQLEAVLVISTCAADDLTGAVGGGEPPYERVFAVNTRDSMQALALADVITERFPDLAQLSVFGYDYVVGRELWENFRTGLQDNGLAVETAQEFFVPLDEQNFRPQVQALARGLEGDVATRGLYFSTYGSGTAAVLQQAQPFGLTEEFAFLGASGGYYPVARSLGGAAPDFWNAYDYHWQVFDGELADRFVSDFEAKTDGRKPVDWSYEGYVAMRAMAAAIEAAGSAEPDAVVEAMADLEFEGPSGPLTMDAATHQADMPVVITHTVGNAEAPEGVELLESFVVEQDEALSSE